MTMAAGTNAGAFVDGLANDDEKIACSKKHAQFKTRVQTLYPICNQNDYNQYSIYDQKQLKNHTFWGCTYLYNSYLSNRPQVSMGYRLINHEGCWWNTRRNRKPRAAGGKISVFDLGEGGLKN